MRAEKTLGLEIRALLNLIDRRMNRLLQKNGVDDVTPMHGMILGYLSSERSQEIYQRDIEAEFDITRSTVTSILKLMEKKGYIRRESVMHDARLKRISLTPFGEETFSRIDSSIREMEALLHTFLSAEEYTQLIVLINKAKSGL